MTELEHQLRSAMHAAVGHEEPPHGLAGAVVRRHRRHVLRVAAVSAAVVALLVTIPVALAASRGSGSPPTTGTGQHHRASTGVRLRGAPATELPWLLLSGSRPGYYDPATRRSDPIAGLPRTRLGYSFRRVVGGWIAEPSVSSPACCAGPALPFYYLADGSRVAVSAGSGYSTGRASSAGELWSVSYRSRTQRLSKAAASARLTNLTGRPAGPALTLPAGYQIVGAVGPDLLLAPAIKLPWPVRDELWNPAVGRVSRYVSGVVAASRAQIAWEPACRCAVDVLNVLTGATFSVRLPGNAWAYGGTFSADGRYLAMALAPMSGGQAVRAGLAVIDVSRHALLDVPGSTVRAAVSDRLTFGWQPGQDLLIASLVPLQSAYLTQWIQVATWRPRASAMRVANVAIPRGSWVVLGDGP